MQIRLAHLKEGVATPVSEEYNPRVLDVESVDTKYPGPIKVEGTVEKGPDTLTFHGVLTAPVEHVCGRCLKIIKDNFEQPFDLYFEIAGKEVIDAQDELRELLLLDHPLSYLCSEKCKGLCPSCGINLNEKSCKCKAEPDLPKSPFAELKNRLNRKKEE